MPRSPSLAPIAERRVLPSIRPVPALSRSELCGSPLFPGARDVSVARPTLAVRVLGSRLCLARVGPGVLYGRLRLRLRACDLRVDAGRARLLACACEVRG